MRHVKPGVVYLVGWVVLVVAVAWYVNFAQGETVSCVYKGLVASQKSDAVRSEAAKRRDKALVGSKKALRQWVMLIDQTGPSPQTRILGHRYYIETGKYIEAQHDLDAARVHHPPPDVRNLC